jgi:deazaflavin-dependent oxidoreductase (nitroreductase family)
VSTNDEQSLNAKTIGQFRDNGGRVSGFGDSPLLLLTTIGAKSGLQRTTPLMYLTDESDSNRVYVFASAAGADKHPAWFHNLVAHPDDLTVEIGGSALKAAGEVVPEPQRGQLYAEQARRIPVFAGYEAKTPRAIPVVALILDGA